MHQKFVQVELARQKVELSMNTNFHNILATLHTLDARLANHINSNMANDLAILRRDYATFKSSAEAWWATYQLQQLPQVQTITQTTARIEQTTTQIRT